jgi:hypothetical protein
VSGKSAKKARQQQVYSGPDWSSLDKGMMRDDVAWLYSFAESVSGSSWHAAAGLSLGTQMARVAYEGFDWLSRKKPPEAASLQRSMSVEIAAARHTLKLVDDTAKHATGVIDDFRRLQQSAGEKGRAAYSLSILARDGRLFSSDRVAAFQQVVDLQERQTPWTPSYSLTMATEMGSLMAQVVSRFGISIAEPRPITLPSGLAPRYQTSDYEDFHAGRLEPEFPNALKDLISAVECGVNGARTIFSASESTFPGPVFRAQFITLSHGLSTLHYLSESWSHLSERSGMRALTHLFERPAVIRLRGMSALRNRSMHYGIPSKLEGLDPLAPMYGLVEATTDSTFDQVKEEIELALDSVSDLLRDWNQTA